MSLTGVSISPCISKVHFNRGTNFLYRLVILCSTNLKRQIEDLILPLFSSVSFAYLYIISQNN